MDEFAFPLDLQRRVQLWSYHRSHSVLLFRANKRRGMETRIDVMFRAVRHMKVNHRYDNLGISILTSVEAKTALGLTDDVIEDRIVFGFTSGNTLDSYVVAGSLYIAEDDLEDGDPSALDNEALSTHIIRSGSYLR